MPLYALTASALPPGGGLVAENRPGYHQRYTGLEVTSPSGCRTDGWRGSAFSTNDWREYFDDPSVAILDPTRGAGAYDCGLAVCRPADRRRAGGA